MSAAAFDRRTTPARPDLAAAYLRGTVVAERFVEGTRRVVTRPSVPLRAGPRPDLRFESELIFGESYVVYEADAEGWSWGQAEADGYVGWLPSDALGPPMPEASTLKVAALRTFVYPGPSIKLPPVLALPFGARLAPVGDAGVFTPIAEGWIWSGHCAPIAAVAPDTVAVAERFIGVPYLWGGRTSLGLDCSALVQTACRASGWPAPRDSDMQERSLGVPIDPDGPLARGDLVFWRGHVGLMVDTTTLLHANGSTMTVVREPLREACERIAAAGGGPMTRARRLGDRPPGT